MRGDRGLTERILNVLRPYASNWSGTLGRGDLVIPQREIPRVIHDILDALHDEAATLKEAGDRELFDVLMTARRSASVQDQAEVLRRHFLIYLRSPACRAAHPLRGAAAIVGLGIPPQGRVYGRTPLGFAVDAIQLALEDAGLGRGDLDGLLLNPGLAWNDLGMGSFQLQQAMGLRDLRLSAAMHLGGATACAMIQHATQAIAAGMCNTVACVFSDAPLKPPAPQGERTSSASAYGFARGWEQAYGYFGVNAMYALVARRHMHRYGTTQDHLGAVAVAQRRWANRNPQAQMHAEPLALDDYQRSRWIVEPLRLFDCCLVSN